MMQKKRNSILLLLFLVFTLSISMISPVKTAVDNKTVYVTDFWYPTTQYGNTEKSLAEMIAEQLENTGFFDITVKSAELSSYLGQLKTMGLFLLSWKYDYPDPINYIDPFVGSGTVSFGVNYSSTAMDGYIDIMRTHPDAATRVTAIKNAQELIATDVPLIPLFTRRPQFIAYQKDVTGLVFEDSEFLHYNNLKESGDTGVSIGTTDSITNLDPADAYDYFSSNILVQITHGLFEMPVDSIYAEPGPLLDSYTMSTDTKTYTFNLKTGIKFSNGDDFNATVMAWNLNRSRFLGGRPGYLLADVINEVNVLDTHKLEIILGVYDVTFLQRLAATTAWPIAMTLPYDALSGNPDNVPIGLGPYKVVSWTPGVEIILGTNEHYFGDTPVNSEVNIKFYTDAATLLIALKVNSIDVAHRGFGLEEMINVMADPNIKSETKSSTGVQYILFNMDMHTDINVRRAIAAAIDRPKIVSTIFNDFNEPFFSVIPKIFTSHVDTFMDGCPCNPNVAGNMTLAGYTGQVITTATNIPKTTDTPTTTETVTITVTDRVTEPVTVGFRFIETLILTLTAFLIYRVVVTRK
ncbi:MAG: ABC transporter substrate-binding protein [Promethearchaeota archaeon]